jgi:MraZ protein
VWQTGEVKAKFFGGYTHTLDLKGRLTLPARFRSNFTDHCYATPSQYGDPCIVIWTVEDFLTFANAVPQENWGESVERLRLRDWGRQAFELEIDRLGRIGLPQPLRTLVDLEREVLVNGAFGTIEVWDPVRWNRYREQNDG